MFSEFKRLNLAQPFKRAFILLTILFVGSLVLYCSPLKQYLGDLREINFRLSQLGMIAPLFYTLVVFILVSFGFPRLILCTLGGMAFGFFWGLFWSQVGTLLGSYAQFLFMRFGGSNFLTTSQPLIKSLKELFKKRGILSVILMRQIPVANIFGNLVLALMEVSHLDFLVGTAIGLIPAAIPSTLIGAGIIQSSLKKSSLYFSIGVILLTGIWLFGSLYLESVKNRTKVSE